MPRPPGLVGQALVWRKTIQIDNMIAHWTGYQDSTGDRGSLARANGPMVDCALMTRTPLLLLLLLAPSCLKDDTPTHASGQPCEEPENCPGVPCTCVNGTLVVAQHCVMTRCQTQQEACPGACKASGGWGHWDAGAWFCDRDQQCPTVPCTCQDGTLLTMQRCDMNRCASGPWYCDQECGPERQGQCALPGEPCEPEIGWLCCKTDCVEGTCETL